MESTERFDWYECDFTSFLLALDLPAYRGGMPLVQIIKDEKENFLNRFQEMISNNKYRKFTDGFYDTLNSKLSEIKRTFNQLIAVIKAYDASDLALAQKQFDQLMDNLKQYFFISDLWWPYYPTELYRVRVSPSEKLKKPKDLFHIPYNKRHLASNERYSLAGNPCLYLSWQLPIAWQECGYPQKYYYSKFQYQSSDYDTDEWKFITFLPPFEVANQFFCAINRPEETTLQIALSAVLTYPLVFACSIVNLNGNTAFKPEFVIPQMLTQWVYRNYEYVKGIKYFSCHDNDKIPYYVGLNVVLPAKNIDSKSGYSKELTRKFKVTKPILKVNTLEKEKTDLVRKYKKDLLIHMPGMFQEGYTCLLDYYFLTDLLDKALINTEESNMRFVITAVRNVSRGGRILLEKINKNDIIAKARASKMYSSRTENEITVFETMYRRFQTDVIKIADDFDSMLDHVNKQGDDTFYSVKSHEKTSAGIKKKMELGESK